MTWRQTAERVRSAEVRATEVTARALAHVRNGHHNAFSTITGELAAASARRVDAEVDAGRDPGPLAGVPLAVKDVHDIGGNVTRHGSRAFDSAPAAPRDCLLVQRLRSAGAVIVGQTTTSELEFSATSMNPINGVTDHPTHPGRSAGGSSGGSAVAVKLGYVDLATGTDGGGSLRVPASACGLPAIKLSPTLIPSLDAWGRPHAWREMSSAGVLAPTLSDVLAALDVLLPTEFTRTGPSLTAVARQALDGAPLRIAWLPELGWSDTSAAVGQACEQAVQMLAEHGAEVHEVMPLSDRDPAASWTTFAAQGTLEWLRSHPAVPDLTRVSPLLAELLQRWGQPDRQRLRLAHEESKALGSGLRSRLARADVLVCPTLVASPPAHADAAAATYVGNTYAFNLTQSPAGTLPVGRDADGMPIGLQFICLKGDDRGLVRAMTWATTMLTGMEIRDEVAPRI